ncbi:MAG: bile acid:sodium symporter [Planctomycetales bacterium]
MFEFYLHWEHELAAAQLILAMLGMGMTLRPRDFGEILSSPRNILMIAAGQIVLAPLVAILVARLLRLPDEILFGMILTTAMPGGALSNIYTYLARGNIPLSITATTFATASCVITAPLVLRVFAAVTIPDSFVMPAGLLMFDIGAYLLLPLGVGMICRRFAPERAEGIHQYFVRGSLLVLGLHVVGALGSGRLDVWSHGWRTPVGLVLFGVIVMVVMVQGSRLLGHSRKDASTMGIEVTLRNTFLALLIKADLFPASAEANPMEQAVLYVTLFYGGASLAIGFGPILINRFLTSATSTQAPSESGESPAND